MDIRKLLADAGYWHEPRRDIDGIDINPQSKLARSRILEESEGNYSRRDERKREIELGKLKNNNLHNPNSNLYSNRNDDADITRDITRDVTNQPSYTSNNFNPKLKPNKPYHENDDIDKYLDDLDDEYGLFKNTNIDTDVIHKSNRYSSFYLAIIFVFI